MDFFTRLPHEIKITIFELLDIETRSFCIFVCKDWKATIMSRQNLAVQKFIFNSGLTPTLRERLGDLQPNFLILGESFNLPSFNPSTEPFLMRAFEKVKVLTIHIGPECHPNIQRWDPVLTTQIFRLCCNIDTLNLICSSSLLVLSILFHRTICQNLFVKTFKLKKLVLVYKGGENLVQYIKELQRCAEIHTTIFATFTQFIIDRVVVRDLGDTTSYVLVWPTLDFSTSQTRIIQANFNENHTVSTQFFLHSNRFSTPPVIPEIQVTTFKKK